MEFSIGLTGSVTPLGPASDLVHHLREQRIDAVLAEYGPVGVEVMAACRQVGVPLVVRFHGYDAYRSDVLAAYGARYPELFRTAAALVAVSQPMCARLRALGAAGDKVHWAPCGYDDARFVPGDVAARPPAFLAVGRLVEKKSPLLTIAAFAQVRQQHPEASLVIVGDGPLRQRCIELARSQPGVDLIGEVTHDEVATWMGRSRVFVQHSVTAADGDSEGTPVSVMEAAGAGLPVVATRHGGIPDVVADGETGFVVEEGDLNGMAAAMLRLARDPALAARMGQAGARLTRRHHSLVVATDRLWTVLEAAALAAEPRQ